MFIVITPKIVRDPLYELEWIKHEEMCRRPGDLPDYLCRLNEARCRERHSLFKGTIDMIAGSPLQGAMHQDGSVMAMAIESVKGLIEGALAQAKKWLPRRPKPLGEGSSE